MLKTSCLGFCDGIDDVVRERLCFDMLPFLDLIADILLFLLLSLFLGFCCLDGFDNFDGDLHVFGDMIDSFRHSVDKECCLDFFGFVCLDLVELIAIECRRFGCSIFIDFRFLFCVKSHFKSPYDFDGFVELRRFFTFLFFDFSFS